MEFINLLKSYQGDGVEGLAKDFATQIVSGVRPVIVDAIKPATDNIEQMQEKVQRIDQACKILISLEESIKRMEERQDLVCGNCTIA